MSSRTRGRAARSRTALSPATWSFATWSFATSSRVLLLALALTGCGEASPQSLTVEILATYPHDPAAFTQGLELVGGKLYESTGIVGASSVREVDLASGEVVRLREVARPHFAEGMTAVGDELWQITWQTGTAFRWDRATFEPLGTFSYQGEGWGLCLGDGALYMTDGSATLARRDPTTFQLSGSVQVTDEKGAVTRLNELECVGDDVYANVWQTDRIVRIDPKSGKVTASIDASALRRALPSGGRPIDVLNGIAYVSERQTFLLTGKYWPLVFEVRFVETAR